MRGCASSCRRHAAPYLHARSATAQLCYFGQQGRICASLHLWQGACTSKAALHLEVGAPRRCSEQALESAWLMQEGDSPR